MRSFLSFCFRPIFHRILAVLMLGVLAGGTGQVYAESVDLTELSIEELINIKVVSASKKKQRLSETPSAVYVITQEDIRRTGVQSIPEALRFVPGLQVAQINSDSWAISSRGFNERFANKLLVLMDGRSIYSHFFSGVFWNLHDTLLEDIDRIEVIRGPGGSVWGANAVNGIINIITKKAEDTQGTLISGGGGNEEKAFGNVRYGGSLGNNCQYRVYTKYFDRDASVDSQGRDSVNDWDTLRAGFKMDFSPEVNNFFTLQGDIYNGDSNESITFPDLGNRISGEVDGNVDKDFSGGNILGRWRHSLANGSEMILQLYYNRDRYKERDQSDSDRHLIELTADTYDIDFQHNFTVGDRQDVIWGMGYRYISDHIDDSGAQVSIAPEDRDIKLYSAFIQDEISLIKEKLKLTLGTKLEDHEFTGIEILPTARLAWTPNFSQTVWASVSRAVRTPSRYDHDVQRFDQRVLPEHAPENFLDAPVLVSLKGSSDSDSETVMAYELGYRIQPFDFFSLDIAAFYNDYDDLRTLAPQDPTREDNYYLLLLESTNLGEAETYGFELAVNWDVFDWWRLLGSYTYLNMNLDIEDECRDDTDLTEGSNPQHQFSLRSYMDFRKSWELDLALRYVDSLPEIGVEGYTAADARIGWKPHSNLELSLIGKNLFDDRHPEFVESLVRGASEIERSIYAKVTLRF